MPRPVDDKTGRRYGRLTVLEFVQMVPCGTRTQATWLCRCDCGNEKVIRSGNLQSRRTKSCGCLRDEGHPSSLIQNTRNG